MDKYETLGVVGEGSYGLVLRCRHRQSGQLVAVKKFIEADEDAAVRRMALREIRMLKVPLMLDCLQGSYFITYIYHLCFNAVYL